MIDREFDVVFSASPVSDSAVVWTRAVSTVGSVFGAIGMHVSAIVGGCWRGSGWCRSGFLFAANEADETNNAEIVDCRSSIRVC
jgi:hypothetical protein